MKIVINKSSKIENSELGLFAERNFWNGATFSWYYCAIVYCFLSGRLQTKKAYGDGYTGETFSKWYKCAMELDPTAANRDIRYSLFWIFTAPFGLMRCLIYVR